MTTTTRLALGGAAAMLTIAAVLWWTLRTIEPKTYAGLVDELQSAALGLLWAAAAGQTLFVLLWLRLPWHTHWVGRALMVKSVALATYLDFALVHHYLAPYPALPLLAVVLFGLIVVGIWWQLVTLAYESTRRRRHGERRG